ncbi:MAG: hypothetical protein ACPIOQ_82890, partial [Promethearchaeia archaeon]
MLESLMSSTCFCTAMTSAALIGRDVVGITASGVSVSSGRASTRVADSAGAAATVARRERQAASARPRSASEGEVRQVSVQHDDANHSLPGKRRTTHAHSVLTGRRQERARRRESLGDGHASRRHEKPASGRHLSARSTRPALKPETRSRRECRVYRYYRR